MVKIAAVSSRDMNGAMPSQKSDTRLLRSRHNFGDSSSLVDSNLVKEASGRERLVRTSSLDSQPVGRVTRLRKGKYQGNVENGGALKDVPPQPDGTGNRRTRFKRTGINMESLVDRKRKRSELLGRRVTRGMDGERSRISTKLANERAQGMDRGGRRNRTLVGKRRNLICNIAGTQIDGSSTVNTGIRKDPGNVRVTRLKMANWASGTEGTFDNLRDETDRNAENIVGRNRENAGKKRKMGQLRIASLDPSLASSDSLNNDKRKETPAGREFVNEALRDTFESPKDCNREASLGMNGSNRKRKGADCPGFSPSVTGKHLEGKRNEVESTAPSEKAPQVKSEMGSVKDSWINGFKAATIASKANKGASDASTQPSNHTGSKARKRKRDAELSPADISEGEVRGPVTRGKLSRGLIGFAAESQAKVRESAAKAVTTADFRDSTVSSLSGPASIDLTQLVIDGDNVPCANVDDIACNVENKQEKSEQAFMMRRSSSRKRIANPVDAEFKLLKTCGLVKEESTGVVSEDRKASCLDKGKEALKRTVQIVEPTNEQNTDVCISKDANNIRAEHLLDISEKVSKANDTASAPELAQDGIESNDVACKIDTRGKYFLVATNPRETGGRQMRPRPLDLEQPLLVLIEGRDQDYYDLDGGAFNRMLQQQLEIKKPASEQTNKGTLQVLEKQDGKRKPIVIPSFRTLPEYEEEQQRLRLMYAIPESYVRASTGTANEYNNHAEYDMDEEDEGWLYNFNQNICSSGMSSKLSEDQFENLMEILENKAADLENSESFPVGRDRDYVLQGTMRQISEECCICNGGENSANNLVFKCADCGILVHQSCYGVQASEIYARDKKWCCSKCESVATGRAAFEVRCALCFKQGGALKPATEAFKWVHVVCALYTNETFFVNTDAMEPIDGLVAADARARKQRRRCWLCGFKEGSVERCSVRTCETVFHVSCGVTQGASFELQHSNQQVVRVRAFCPKHANVAPVSSNLKQKGFDGIKEDKKSSLSAGFEERFLITGEEIEKHNPVSKQRDQRRLVREASAAQNDCSVQEKVDITHNKSASVGDDCKCISLRHRMVAPDCAKQRYFDGKAKEPNIVSEACIELDGLERSNLREKVIAKANEDQDSVLSLKDALELDVAAPEFVEGVYWYWASKRAACGGALLHRIQQEQAARNFGIFNSNAAYDKFSSSLFQGNGFRQSGVSFEIRHKMVAARQQLQKLKELTSLIVRRERIKFEIYSIDLDITRLILEDLRATGTGRNCSWCKGMGFALQCNMCNRDFCVHCFKSKRENGSRSWLAALKLLKYLCFGCQKEKHQEQDVLASRISYLVEENETNYKSCQDIEHQGKDLPSLVNTTFEQEQRTPHHECHNIEVCCERKDELFQDDHEKVADVAVGSTKCAPNKPNILFPPSSLNNLDKSACEAFWESVEQESRHKKTVLVSELLKTMLSKSHDDVADAAKKHCKSSFRRTR